MRRAWLEGFGRIRSDSAADTSVIEAGNDDRGDARVWDVKGSYGAAFGSELDWHWPTSDGKAIMG